MGEFTQEERERAEKDICFSGRESGIRIYTEEPVRAWDIGVQTQMELNRANAAIARLEGAIAEAAVLISPRRWKNGEQVRLDRATWLSKHAEPAK